MTTLDALLAAVPGDAQAIAALADFLEEQSDPRGELLRLVFALTRSAEVPDRESMGQRMRQLLLQGVKPVGPYRTVPIARRCSMTFAWIPPGVFVMGSPPAEAVETAEAVGDHRFHIRAPGYCREEQPQHAVAISEGFWLGVHQVTQSQWKAVMGSNPSRFHRAKHPVEQLSWSDASAFCKQLQAVLQQNGLSCRCRLPREAEWEYACRAGTSTPWFWGASLPAEQARFMETALPWGEAAPRRTVPVGSYPANAFGLHEMHGNVWEWCSDWFGPDYYARSPATAPKGPARGRYHVLRGGSALVLAHECRSAIRGEAAADGPDRYATQQFALLGDFGLRVVCRFREA
jgi:sulfatase modifying factor 1